MFSVFHPDAHDLFNTCSDLKKVAWELWDPKRRLNEEVALTFNLGHRRYADMLLFSLIGQIRAAIPGLRSYAL